MEVSSACCLQARSGLHSRCQINSAPPGIWAGGFQEKKPARLDAGTFSARWVTLTVADAATAAGSRSDSFFHATGAGGVIAEVIRDISWRGDRGGSQQPAVHEQQGPANARRAARSARSGCFSRGGRCRRCCGRRHWRNLAWRSGAEPAASTAAGACPAGAAGRQMTVTGGCRTASRQEGPVGAALYTAGALRIALAQPEP